jgi:outer membrane usher protein
MSHLPRSRWAVGRRAQCGAAWFVLAALVALPAPAARAQPAPEPRAPAPAPPQQDERRPPSEEGEPPPPPPQEGELEPPSQEGEPTPPSQEGEPTPPSQEGEPEPPSQEGEVAPPAQGGPAAGVPDPEAGEGPTQPAAPPPSPPTAPESVEPHPELGPEVLTPAAPSFFLAPFTLVVNEVVKGETILGVGENNEIFIQPSELEAAGLINVPRGREFEHEGMRFVALAELTPPLEYELNERDIELRLTAPLDLLPKSDLNVVARPSHIEYQSPTSMYVNYSLRVTDQGEYSAYDELVVSHGGDLMYTSMTIASTGGPVRGFTNYTINDRSKLRRLVLGDAAVSTGQLGTSTALGGWTLSRAYDLDPYVVRQPTLRYAGSTLTPATLDVYLNGSLTRSIDLQPGRFELGNLRTGLGAGEATYVLRDVFGNESVIETPFYLSDLLAKGLDEFTYSVGLLRPTTSESWGYDRPALLGVHRYGVTEYLTMAGRMEAAENLLSAGGSTTVATPLGELSFNAAASTQRRSGPGWATLLAYAYVSPKVSFGAVGSMTSDHYAHLTLDAELDRSVREASTFVSVPIKKWATTGASAYYAMSGTDVELWGATATCSLNVLPTLPVTLAGKVNQRDEIRTWEIMLGASVAFGGHHRASANAKYGSQDPQLMANITRPPLDNGWGYSAGTTLSETQKTANTTVQYQAPVGRYSANYSYVRGGERSGFADAAGALVLVPGMGLFATLPVLDSFGVVSVPGVKNVRVTVNNQEMGKTNRHGNALVPNLLSYYGNRLGLKLEDVPMSYDVKSDEQVLAPPQRGAAIAVFPSVQPHYFRGTFVVDASGKRVIPDFGQARVLEKNGAETITPLGPLGEFEILDPTPGTHQVTVEYLGGNCTFELTFPETAETVIDMGELVCHR